jgi:lipoprotein-anchoring transpeptidase ErfK/SrfK
MKKLTALLAGLLVMAFALAGETLANAKAKQPSGVNIRIDISSQSMVVDVGGRTFGRWKVSTARDGYYTPRGAWRPYMLKKMHYSRKYDNSPMPHSIFFLGGYAIHGTGYVKSLGRPASHGCIRLHPRNAAKLYALVQKHGKRSTRVIITN